MLRSPDPLDEKVRACQACAVAKAKCVKANASSEGCFRCQRLGKECIVPPRSTKKRRAPNGIANIGHLERRIDNLVTLLSNAGGTVGKQASSVPPGNHELHTSSSPAMATADRSRSGHGIAPTPAASKVNFGFPLLLPNKPSIQLHPPLQPVIPNVPNGELFVFGDDTPESAPETPFEIYKRYFEPMMPFSFLAPGKAATELQSEKPWLYRTCSMVGGYKDRVSQTDAAETIILELSQEMLLRGKRSLDMLQSLIVHDSWSYYYSRVRPSKHSHAGFQLAVAMLYDLGLAKPARRDEGPHELISAPLVKEVPENGKTEKRSAEEQRVLLACYVLASTYSLCIRKIEVSPAYSPYIGYCCERILNGPHDSKDESLVVIVKLQSKIEAFYRSLPAKEVGEDVRAPIWMHVKSLESDLKEYWRSLPAGVEEDFFVVLHFKTARILLYEPSLHKTLFPSTAFEAANSKRLDMLYACLTVCQEAIEHFLAQPLQFYATVTTPLLAHLGYILSTLIKLSLIEEPGWELDHVRHTVNVVAYLAQLTTRMQDVGVILDQYNTASSLPSMPSMCARAIRKVTVWYEAKIAAEAGPAEELLPPSVAGAEMNFGVDMDIDLFDFNDPYWLDFATENGLPPA